MSLPDIETWDKVAENYSLEISEPEKEIGDLLEQIFNELGTEKTSTIIELGCGSGHLSGILSKKGYSNINLLDFSPVALEKASMFFNKLNIKGNFILGDIFNLDKSKQYDITWNSGVLEHFTETQLMELLNSIKDITKKYFIFFVPNVESLPYLLYRYGRMSRDEWEFGEEYLHNDYDKFLNNAGFKIINKKYIGANFCKYFINDFIGDVTLGKAYSFLEDNQFITENNRYLVAYVTVISDNIELQKNINEIDFVTRTKEFDNFARDTEYAYRYRELASHDEIKEKLDLTMLELQNLKNSVSWKLTKPLRKLNQLFKRS